jgi:hypothetical protein
MLDANCFASRRKLFSVAHIYRRSAALGCDGKSEDPMRSLIFPATIARLSASVIRDAMQTASLA